MSARVRFAGGDRVLLDELSGIFDPLAPELGSQVMRLTIACLRGISGSRWAGDSASAPELLPRRPIGNWQSTWRFGRDRGALEVARRSDPAFVVLD
jgi:hypothetical protein